MHQPIDATGSEPVLGEKILDLILVQDIQLHRLECRPWQALALLKQQTNATQEALLEPNPDLCPLRPKMLRDLPGQAFTVGYPENDHSLFCKPTLRSSIHEPPLFLPWLE
jgi:hypothetical protein